MEHIEKEICNFSSATSEKTKCVETLTKGVCQMSLVRHILMIENTLLSYSTSIFALA